MKVFYPVAKSALNEILECGLLLGDEKKTARLNPNDFGKNEIREDEILVKIDLSSCRANIYEGALDNKARELSGIPAEDYELGMYRNPECEIECSILPKAISEYDALLDEPIIYRNSEELFLATAFARAEQDENFREEALALYFKTKYRYEESDGKIIFRDEDSNRIYVLKKG